MFKHIWQYRKQYNELPCTHLPVTIFIIWSILFHNSIISSNVFITVHVSDFILHCFIFLNRGPYMIYILWWLICLVSLVNYWLFLSSPFFSLLFFLFLKKLAALTGRAESSEVHVSPTQEIRRNCLWVLSQRRLCHHAFCPLPPALCWLWENAREGVRS